MNVCIVGGGHIGTTLTCYIKHHDPSLRVSLFTRRPERFARTLKCNDWEGGFSFETDPDCISADPSAAAAGADIVFVALPSFAVEKAFADIAPFVARDAMIGVLPGGGGCEFFFGRYFTPEQSLFGFQRVPFTAKLEHYGQETNLKSWKPFSVVGTQKADRLARACAMVETCGLRTRQAGNYLSVALTPTNPILHTSRIYDLFGGYDAGHVFAEQCKFYVGWSDATSETMLAMDGELHALLDQITEFDTSAIRPLTEHYESPDVPSMTRKINSIATFQSVYAPMRPAEDGAGFVADLQNRMFTEDFPWGLAIIRAYCELFGTKAPTMDRVLGWYAQYLGLSWYEDGRFCGRDLQNTGVPQRYGIRTREQLLSFYR